MSLLAIREYGDPILRKMCKPVVKIDEEIHKCVEDMRETMYFYKGVGLAASQVGFLKRVIVLDVGEGLIVLINPEIVTVEGEANEEEGCLSLPKIIIAVKRAGKVVVQGMDLFGNHIEMKADGLLARGIQHEIDHLDGILMIDRVSSAKRISAINQFKNRRQDVPRELF